MRRVYQVASLPFIAMSMFVVLEARRMRYYTEYGPGPGFFPFWLGCLMLLLSAMWLLQVTFKSVEPMESSFVPDRKGVLRLLSALVALVLFTVFVEVVGFRLAMLAFMLFVLMAFGRQNILVTVLISLLVSFGMFYVFQNWLDVRLPYADIEFLRNLGL